MSRQRLALLIIGWLLGLLTAIVWPGVVAERQSYVPVDPAFAPGDLRRLASEGWVVTRTDTAGSVAVYQLERPRYLGIVEAVRGATKGPLPTPDRSLPKPTDAPKPTTGPRAP